MKSIQLHSHVDADGLLQIELVDCQDQDVEVLVVYQPMPRSARRKWSQTFLNAAGSWQGEGLTRESQPLATDREPLL